MPDLHRVPGPPAILAATAGTIGRKTRLSDGELVRTGRSPEELAREFEPSAESIRNWVRQADLDEGRRSDGLTTEERAELRRLRRENRQLRIEREILSKVTA
jgi:transposase